MKKDPLNKLNKEDIYACAENKFNKNLSEEDIEKIKQRIQNPQEHLDWFLIGTALGFKKGWGYYQAKEKGIVTEKPEVVDKWINYFWDKDVIVKEKVENNNYRKFLEECREIRKKYLPLIVEELKEKIEENNIDADLVSVVVDFMSGDLENKLKQIEYFEEKREK